MKRKALALTFIVALLFSVIAGTVFVKLAGANPMGMPPAPIMPSITIGSDGSINPSNVSIRKTGNVYTLTGNIKNYSLDIECDNITLDGAGFAFQEDQPSKFAPSSAITIYSNGVTVKNMNIQQHETAIIVYGANNTVTKILASNVRIEGNCNEIIENTFPGSYLIVAGNHNIIKGNILQARGIVLSGSSDLNTVIANTIEHCTHFAVLPSNGTNFFYLNNFINNTNLPGSSLPREISDNLNLAILAQTHISPMRWQSIPNGWKAIYPNNTVFDNGSYGNYWSDYSGADANYDGIGDTPYIIGGNLQDHYPLMLPVDISSPTPSQSPSSSLQETKLQLESEPFPITFIAAAILPMIFVSISLLAYSKKRKR